MEYFKTNIGNVYASNHGKRDENDVRATKVEYESCLRDDYIKDLTNILKPEYTMLRHVSQSGMTRHISCFVVDNGSIRCIDYQVSKITGWKISNKTSGLIIQGCGMDMGFHVVYNLGRYLFQDTDTLEQSGRSDGGYLINQEWL